MIELRANRIVSRLAACLALLLADTALGAWESKLVVGELHLPTAVAVQPDTEHVFVAESARGRVIRVVEGVASEVITELPSDSQASPPRGPQGLLFLDAQTLVVAGMGPPEQPSGLLLFRVPSPGSPPLTPRDAVRVDAAQDAAPPLREDLGGLLRTRTGVLVGTTGSAAQGWVLRAESKPSEDSSAPASLGSLQRFVDAGRAADVPGPVCLAVSPRGELVVGHAGLLGTPGDSRVTLFRASDQKRLLTLSAGLHDLVGLCYSSAQSPAAAPLLYAIDAGAASPEAAGLYRLDATFRNNTQAIQATRVLPLERPASIAAGPDQGFYVTTLGPANAEAAKAGRLLQLTWKP